MMQIGPFFNYTLYMKYLDGEHNEGKHTYPYKAWLYYKGHCNCALKLNYLKKQKKTG